MIIKKPVDNLREDFHSKLKSKCPDDEEKPRRKKLKYLILKVEKN